MSNTLRITSTISRTTHAASNQRVNRHLITLNNRVLVPLTALAHSNVDLRTEVLERLEEEIFLRVDLAISVEVAVHIHVRFIRLRRRDLRLTLSTQRSVCLSVRRTSTNTEPGLTDNARRVFALKFSGGRVVRICGKFIKQNQSCFRIREHTSHNGGPFPIKWVCARFGHYKWAHSPGLVARLPPLTGTREEIEVRYRFR